MHNIILGLRKLQTGFRQTKSAVHWVVTSTHILQAITNDEIINILSTLHIITNIIYNSFIFAPKKNAADRTLHCGTPIPRSLFMWQTILSTRV